MVDNLVPAGAALAKHHGSAHSAEQLGGKQIIILRFVPGRGPAILGDLLLNAIKQFFFDDGRNRVRHHNILKPVLPYIAPVGQQGLELL